MRQPRCMGHVRVGRRIKGGKISNMKKLEEDFAKSITFGKTEPKKTSEAIKKKFSI